MTRLVTLLNHARWLEQWAQGRDPWAHLRRRLGAHLVFRARPLVPHLDRPDGLGVGHRAGSDVALPARKPPPGPLGTVVPPAAIARPAAAPARPAAAASPAAAAGGQASRRSGSRRACPARPGQTPQAPGRALGPEARITL